MDKTHSNVSLVSFQQKLTIQLLPHLPKGLESLDSIEPHLAIPTDIPPILRKGIYYALLQALLRLIDRHTDPLLSDIIPEYMRLVEDIQEVYKTLRPTEDSNWLDECIQYGDKSAYHWIWKHFDSHELF